MAKSAKEQASGTIGFRQIVENTVKGTRIAKSLPDRAIPDDYIAQMIRSGYAFTASPNPYEAQAQIAAAPEDRIVILPLEHRAEREHSNRINKTFTSEFFLDLDLADALNNAIESAADFHNSGSTRRVRQVQLIDSTAPKFIARICEEEGLYPKLRIQGAAQSRKQQLEVGRYISPPLGFFFIGSDNILKAVTWKRAIGGLEDHVSHQTAECPIHIGDKIYNGNAVATIGSSSRPKSKYIITYENLPIAHQNDTAQFSGVYAMRIVDSTLDAAYRGRMHGKSGNREVQLWTRNGCHGFYDIAARLSETNECPGKRIYINPLPMLRRDASLGCDGYAFDEKLKTQTVVGRRGLNVTEMDQLIGARVTQEGYWKVFMNAKNWRTKLVG